MVQKKTITMKKLFLILFLLPLFVSAQFKNNNKQIINVLNYGAKGDAKILSDGVTNGTTTFTSATAAFTSTAVDGGKLIRITGAAGSSNDLITTIASVTNSTTVVLTVGASTTASGLAFEYGTNNTTAIQAAANAVPTTGGVLYFPLGYYIKNGYTNIPNTTAITGDMSARFGDYDSAAVYNRPHSKIIEVAYNLPQSINIQAVASTWSNLDLAGTTGKAPTSGVLLNINASGVSLYNSNIGSPNIWTGVSQNYSAYWTAVHCSIAGYQYGLVIQNLQTADAGDWTITDCQFGGYGAPHPSSSCVRVLSSGGMKMTNNKFNSGYHKGIDIEILSSASTTSDFQISNNSFENFDSTAIFVATASTGAMGNVQIYGNQIAPFTAHTTGIYLNGAGTPIKGVVITSNLLYNTGSGDTAIKCIAVQDAMIQNVIFGSWTLPVYVDGTSTSVSYVAPSGVAYGTTDNGLKSITGATSDGTNLFLPTVVGGSGAGGNITLSSTTSGTKGKIILDAARGSYFSESVGNLALGTSGASNSAISATFSDLTGGGAISAGVNMGNSSASSPGGGQYNIAPFTSVSGNGAVIMQFSANFGSGATAPFTTQGGVVGTRTNDPMIFFQNSNQIARVDATGLNPFTNVTFDLGTSSLAWRDIYLSHPIGKSTIGASSSLGTNVTSVTPSGNDAYFSLTVVTSATATGTIGLVAFGRTWGATPKCVISSADAATGAMIASAGGYVALKATSTSSMTLAGLFTGAGTWVFNCNCGQ